MHSIARTVLLGAFALTAQAADVTGTWMAEFETMIGVQKYTYVLHAEGGTLTGKVIGTREGEEPAEVVLTEGQVHADEIHFVENLSFQGQDLRIVYDGRLTGDDELKLTRRVGEVATEELVAHRAKG